MQDSSGGAQAVLLRFEGEPTGPVPQDLREDLGHSFHHHRALLGHLVVLGTLQLLRQFQRPGHLEQGASAQHQGISPFSRHPPVPIAILHLTASFMFILLVFSGYAVHRFFISTSGRTGGVDS